MNEQLKQIYDQLGNIEKAIKNRTHAKEGTNVPYDVQFRLPEEWRHMSSCVIRDLDNDDLSKEDMITILDKLKQYYEPVSQYFSRESKDPSIIGNDEVMRLLESLKQNLEQMYQDNQPPHLPKLK